MITSIFLDIPYFAFVCLFGLTLTAQASAFSVSASFVIFGLLAFPRVTSGKWKSTVYTSVDFSFTLQFNSYQYSEGFYKRVVIV